MADRIHASSEWLDKCARDLQGVENAINGASGELGSVNLRRDEGGNLRASLSCSLRMNGARFSADNAADDIRQLQRAAAALCNSTSSFRSGVSKAARLFEQAENKAVQLMRGTSEGNEGDIYSRDGSGDEDRRGWKIDPHAFAYFDQAGLSDSYADGYGIPDHISYSDLGFFSRLIIFGLGGTGRFQSGDKEMFKLFGVTIGVTDGVISGEVSRNTKIGILDVNQTVRGELLGYSTKSYNGKWETKEKDGKITSGAKIGREEELHLAQGKYARDINGLLHREITGTVGQISAEGTAGISLYKDGKFSPALEAKLKAEAVGLKGSLEDRIGTEDYNYHTKASGSLGVANAEATVGVGRITYKDDNGVEHTDWGAQAKVGAEAYLAEGKVTGGFTIMGIKIDAGISGKLGGAGASAGGQVTASGASGNVDLGFGAGLGLNLSVDWSGFKPPKLPEIKLPDLKLPKFKLF